MKRLLLALAVVSLVNQPSEFEPWTPGTLDIHQLATGRGNAAFIRYPDGTAMLLDAGDSDPSDPANGVVDDSKPPAETILKYLRRMMNAENVRLDYALLTHYHPDHIGAFVALAQQLQIDEIIDRGDAYLRPPAADRLFQQYRQFVDGRVASGQTQRVEARAGATDQVAPRRNDTAAFEARIVSVNDRVWTGSGDTSKNRFPPLSSLSTEDQPTENMCSVTLRIKYGAFDYFTGGDQSGYPVPGAPSWHDVESDVARAIGPTDVHVVNHHGSIEGENPFWLATLKSQVMIVPAWAPTHPSPDVLKRMLSSRIYPGPRDIFITRFRSVTKATIGARASQVASDRGHVVVRVEPGGRRFWVFGLDDADDSYRVRLVKGPYLSR